MGCPFLLYFRHRCRNPKYRQNRTTNVIVACLNVNRSNHNSQNKTARPRSNRNLQSNPVGTSLRKIDFGRGTSSIMTDRLDKFPLLETRRLLFREASKDDAPALYEIFSREEVVRYWDHLLLKNSKFFSTEKLFPI